MTDRSARGAAAPPKARFIWVFAMALFPLGLGGLLVGGFDIATGLESRKWEPVEGKVLSSALVAGTLGPDQPEIRYAYEFGGASYVGVDIWPGRFFKIFPLIAPGAGEAVRSRFTPGSVTVFVDPDHPERAALVPGAGRALRWTAIFALFIIMGVWGPASRVIGLWNS